jgi:hypothetical protein
MSDAEVSSPEVSADKLDAAPTDEWRSYDEFAAGIDTYRLPNADLTGQTIAVELTGGPTVHLEFLDSGTVSCWNVRRRPQRARLAAFMARRALIGRRVMWVYSEQHAYEHVYLSPQWYTWQRLAGPERGLADTDENSVWQLRPGIYVFTWREKVIPCASVTVADHRDARAIRSHGYLFGLDEAGVDPVHFTFGAFGRLISTTVHPDRYDPAI